MMEQEKASADQIEQEGWEEALAQVMSGDQSTNKRKKKRLTGKKKLVILLLVGLAVAAAVLLRSCGSGTAKAFVMTKTLEKKHIVNSLSIQGPVSGTNSVHVASNLNAEIIEILVKEGDLVEKDQLLGVIDDEDVQKEVDIAHNAYNLAQTEYQDELTKVTANYAKAKQELDTASKELQRLNALSQSGAVSQVELEAAQNLVSDAKRELLTYQLSEGRPVPSETYTLRIENAKLQLDQRQEALENTKLKSPIAGTVVRVNSKVGQYADKVEDDKPIFIVENLDELEINISISEYSIGKVRVGQPVTIRADILNGETVQGEVVTISPTGEEKGGGSTERVIPTTVKIVEDDTRLIAGINAKADILLEEQADVLVVPISALIQSDEGDFIGVAEAGIARLVAVETGVESDIEIAVTPVAADRLTEGMQIIINPFEGMVEGTAVIVEEN